MNKIGIFYICTGNYSLFWNDFYNTFKKNFCRNSELYFFVFSDKEMDFSNQENVHFRKIQNQPWPLITLLRFHTFLSAEEDVKDMNYLFFFNSNMVCDSVISEDEILPSEDEKYVFVQHPGYCYTRKQFIPYDRNPKCTAYIPYNKGGTYVIGAVEGGEKDAFLDMCKKLKNNIEFDLKQNIIARWHDESQINHFIYKIENYKLLNPGYCYPVGFDLPFERKISGVSKQAKFDVKSFKTNNVELNFFQKVYRFLDAKLFPNFKYMRDKIFFKNIK